MQELKIIINVDENGDINIVTEPTMNLMFALGLLETAKKILFENQQPQDTTPRADEETEETSE